VGELHDGQRVEEIVGVFFEKRQIRQVAASAAGESGLKEN
jgi:hypothetical protein